MSEAINRLVALASRSGLQSSDGEWGESFVHWFDCAMPDAVLRIGHAAPIPEYFIAARTPYLPAHQGFIDRTAKAAITFQTDAQ